MGPLRGGKAGRGLHDPPAAVIDVVERAEGEHLLSVRGRYPVPAVEAAVLAEVVRAHLMAHGARDAVPGLRRLARRVIVVPRQMREHLPQPAVRPGRGACHRHVAGRAGVLDLGLETGVVHHLASHRRLPVQIPGGVRHHGPAPVVSDRDVRAGLVAQIAVADDALLRGRENTGLPPAAPDWAATGIPDSGIQSAAWESARSATPVNRVGCAARAGCALSPSIPEASVEPVPEEIDDELRAAGRCGARRDAQADVSRTCFLVLRLTCTCGTRSTRADARSVRPRATSTSTIGVQLLPKAPSVQVRPSAPRNSTAWSRWSSTATSTSACVCTNASHGRRWA